MIPDLVEPIVAYKSLRLDVGDDNEYCLTSGTVNLLVPSSHMYDVMVARIYSKSERDAVYVEMEKKYSVHLPRWDTMEPVTAYCGHGCEQTPGNSCANKIGNGCGIYAYKEPWPGINAEVLLWGRVFEYERGWRAEHAQLRALIPGVTSLDDFQDMFPDIPRLKITPEFAARRIRANEVKRQIEYAAYLETLRRAREVRERVQRGDSSLWTPSSYLLSSPKRSTLRSLFRRGV